MIIVKTKNGDSFINDKKMEVITHDKGTRHVYFYNGQHSESIDKVESVNYFSDAQPTSYCDRGSEVEELLLKLEILDARKDYWHNLAGAYSNFTFALRTFVESIQGSLDVSDQNDAQKVLDEIDAEMEKLSEDYKKFSTKISELENKLKSAQNPD